MKLSENGIQKKNGELIVNITEFGLFSGTYDSIWITDDHYENEYDYIMELYENKDEDPLPKKILEIENITKDDIEIEVNSKPFLKAIGEVYCSFFENTFGGNWEYDSHISPKYYNYTTDQIFIKCTNPNPKLKFHLLSYKEDILNKEIDPYEVEIYDIYNQHYGYECFQNNLNITIKGIKI